ncbi:MAG TPA: hypothetical protein VGI64_15605 [Streptosporangiaceae bacterium]
MDWKRPPGGVRSATFEPSAAVASKTRNSTPPPASRSPVNRRAAASACTGSGGSAIVTVVLRPVGMSPAIFLASGPRRQPAPAGR